MEYTIYLLFYGKRLDIFNKICSDFDLELLNDTVSIKRVVDKDNEEFISVNKIFEYAKNNNNFYSSIYYAVKNNVDFKFIVLTFTYDNNLIIGFYAPEESMTDKKCIDLAGKIYKIYNADGVKILFENLPPSSKNEYDTSEPFLSLEIQKWIYR